MCSIRRLRIRLPDFGFHVTTEANQNNDIRRFRDRFYGHHKIDVMATKKLLGEAEEFFELSAGEANKAGVLAKGPTELRHRWKKGVRLTKTSKLRVQGNGTRGACRSVLYVLRFRAMPCLKRGTFAQLNSVRTSHVGLPAAN